METVDGWNEADQYKGYPQYQWRPAEQHLEVAQASEPAILREPVPPESEDLGFPYVIASRSVSPHENRNVDQSGDPNDSPAQNRPRTIEDVRAGKRDQPHDVDPITPGLGSGGPLAPSASPMPITDPRERVPPVDPPGGETRPHVTARAGRVMAPPSAPLREPIGTRAPRVARGARSLSPGGQREGTTLSPGQPPRVTRDPMPPVPASRAPAPPKPHDPGNGVPDPTQSSGMARPIPGLPVRKEVPPKPIPDPRLRLYPSGGPEGAIPCHV
jgi:hypothetical protein